MIQKLSKITVVPAILLLTTSVQALSAETKTVKKPNIVFILADDVNRDSLGVYGNKDCKTPNIDRLAKDGVRFDRAYCSVAMCAPFRMELYSGRTPWRTGTMANHSSSKPDTKSIVHYLKPLGYRVALLGKSHARPEECYPFEFTPDKGRKFDNNPLLVEASTKLMDECAEKSEPFCLFIASRDGHTPWTTGDPSAYDPKKLTIPPYWLDTEELRESLVAYYAEVTNFDALVGQIRAALEKRGLWENTIFMVCSEQGSELPFAKWTCYDNGLHTGLVAHWPGVTKPGGVVNGLVSIADITPTFVDAAGGTLKPTDCDGKSFLSLLKGQSQSLHKYVYGAFANCNIAGNATRIYPIRVIRNDSFSLIYNPNHTEKTSNITINRALRMIEDPQRDEKGVAPSWVRLSRKEPAAKQLVHKLHHRPEYELYDLASDPHELTNVIDKPEHAKVVTELKAQLHARLKELDDENPIQTEQSLIKGK
jgi:uncharacterized sulfatase